MNKPKATDKLIPVRDYAQTYLSRRGVPVRPQYIYKLIAEHKKGNRTDMPFKYKEIDRTIWIVK